MSCCLFHKVPVSNLAHTYLFIIFASIVHIWAIAIVIAEIWVRGHPVTFREVKYELRGADGGMLLVHTNHRPFHFYAEYFLKRFFS